MLKTLYEIIEKHGAIAALAAAIGFGIGATAGVWQSNERKQIAVEARDDAKRRQDNAEKERDTALLGLNAANAALKAAETRIADTTKRASDVDGKVSQLRGENERLAASVLAGKVEVEKLTAENAKLKRAVPPRVTEPRKPIELTEAERRVFSLLHKKGDAMIFTIVEELKMADGTARLALKNLWDHGLIATTDTYQFSRLSDAGLKYANQIGLR